MHPFSTTSAAQFLPFDIIHEIFTHHVTTLSISSSGKANTFPWFLGHVCASWRTVFLSMYPEFWSSLIMLPAAPLNTVNGERSLDIVTTFMECTKGMPISFSLHLQRMPPPVIDFFIKHCKQWEHVELILEQKQFSLLCSIKDRLPFLCSLRLHLTNPLALLIDSPEPIIYFENAPRLTHVELQPPWRWRFYWPSLSTLILGPTPEFDMWLEILPQLENLETLHILQDRFLDTEVTNIAVSITMTSLKVLRTGGCMILALLTAPSLEILQIETCRDWYFSHVLSTFFGRSACRLLGLSIGECHDTESLATILPLVPTIETLYLGRLKTHNPTRFNSLVFLRDFFHALAGSPGEPLQLPQLCTIRFSILPPITEEDVSALRSMITLHPHPKMREILILLCQEHGVVQDQVLRMLDKLGRECEIQGIQIKIKPISYLDYTSLLHDGNRTYFNIPFTTKLYR